MSLQDFRGKNHQKYMYFVQAVCWEQTKQCQDTFLAAKIMKNINGKNYEKYQKYQVFFSYSIKADRIYRE